MWWYIRLEPIYVSILISASTLFFFFLSLLLLRCLVYTLRSAGRLTHKRSRPSCCFALLCFALLPTTKERRDEGTNVGGVKDITEKEKKNKMFPRQRLRQIAVAIHDDSCGGGFLGQRAEGGQQQHVLSRAHPKQLLEAEAEAVGATRTTTTTTQQQEHLAKPTVRGNIALVALIVPVLLVVIGAGVWWWWKRRRFGKGRGGGGGGGDG